MRDADPPRPRTGAAHHGPVQNKVTDAMPAVISTMRTFHLIPSVRALLVLALPHAPVSAQDYVTPDQFAHTIESDLIYGIDTNYLGALDTLRLDVYKPIGNTDARRPLLVCAHGGNWLGGCKDDPNGIVPLLLRFVARGYVVASINYRLGWHKDDFVSDPVAGYPLSPWPDAYRAFYAADSLEMVRAIYRGMQDMKGAIRFMLGRAEQDSVCMEKLFVAGESAGAFVALAAAFLDRPAEKPASCYAVPDAPLPYYKCANITALGCSAHTWTTDEGMLHRPDLGPVEGDINTDLPHARVKGVAAFYGGVPLDAFALDWWHGVDTPSVYLFHQTCDGVVLSGTGRPLTTMSANCNLGATPWHTNYPVMAGSLSIAESFAAMTAPPALSTDFVVCEPFDPAFALFECARYADDGSYHYTLDPPARAALLSSWWEPVSAGPAACSSMGLDRAGGLQHAPYPIPAASLLHIPGLADGEVQVWSVDGRCIARSWARKGAVDVRLLPNGTYLLRLANGSRTVRFVVAR